MQSQEQQYSIPCANCGDEIKPGTDVVLTEDCSSYRKDRWHTRHTTIVCVKIACRGVTAPNAVWNGHEPKAA